LSNFDTTPINLFGVEFKSAEHAFQAMKTNSEEEARWVADAPTPNIARRRGQKVKLCSDWEEKKVGIMRFIIFQKFAQNPQLTQKLLSTEDRFLVEGNTWGDKFWGVYNGRGQNHLGRILMDTREALREGKPVIL